MKDDQVAMIVSMLLSLGRLECFALYLIHM